MRACYKVSKGEYVYGTEEGFWFTGPHYHNYWFDDIEDVAYFQGLTAGRKLPDTLALLLGIYHEND